MIFVNFHIESRLYILQFIWNKLYVTEKQSEKFHILYNGFKDYMIPTIPEDYTDMRISIISYYSLRRNHDPVCECCGMSIWSVLSIDYVNDNRIYCCNCNFERTFHKENTACTIYGNLYRKSPTSSNKDLIIT